MRIKPLPPLKSLIAFESAARNLSFTKASDELCVTQGAVSKQVKLLEDYLQQDLFERSKKQLELTDCGKNYYQSVRFHLIGLSNSTMTALKENSQQHFTIATFSGLASQWLIPKFVEFEARHPNADVRINIVRSLDHYADHEFDVGVFISKDELVEFDAIPLFDEVIFPVCSPKFLEQHPEIKDPKKLSSSKLLMFETKGSWVNWHEWLSRCNLPAVQSETTKIRINDFHVLTNAAINGQGVGLAWKGLSDRYINEGLLVKPIENTLATGDKYYLITPKGVELKPQVKAFIEFLTN